MSVLCLSLALSLLFTAFTRVNCSIWATAHTQSCVSLSKKKKNPFHCCDSNERHCRNVAPIWNRGGQSSHHDAARASHNPLLETNISPWWLETAGSARHTASWQRVVLASQPTSSNAAKQTVNIRRWKSVTPTFKAGHGFIKRVRQKRRGPLLWKQICRWGSCLWDVLNVWLTRKLSSSNTGRENRKTERKKCGQTWKRNQAVFVWSVNWYKMMLC